MQENLGQDSGWIISSVLEHTINFSKYNPLAGINYIEFPKEKEHPKKGFINIPNGDESCRSKFKKNYKMWQRFC